ncbi:hypothetical protein BKA69DRAFT_1125859 [Paraphysoderma sedebokerense]|nr:hypothetical protein BKA69DRAFT_1125859 [Paraphysoderma sedebokerense]
MRNWTDRSVQNGSSQLTPYNQLGPPKPRQFADLPDELILEIFRYLDNSIIKTLYRKLSKRFFYVLVPSLYQFVYISDVERLTKLTKTFQNQHPSRAYKNCVKSLLIHLRSRNSEQHELIDFFLKNVVGSFGNLRHLSLEIHCSESTVSTKLLTSFMVEVLPKLKDLRFCDIENYELDNLQLKSLEASDFEISTACIVELVNPNFEALTAHGLRLIFPRLERLLLDLRDSIKTKFYNEFWCMLSHSAWIQLLSIPTLKTVELHQLRISADWIPSTLLTFQSASIRSLTIDQMTVSNDQMQCMFGTLPNLSALTMVRVCGSYPAITTVITKLKYLNLNSCELKNIDHIFQHLFNTPQRQQKLEEFRWSLSALPDKILNGITGIRTLSTVNFGYFYIPDSALTSFFMNAVFLRRIVLIELSIQADQIVALLKVNPRLELIEITNPEGSLIAVCHYIRGRLKRNVDKRLPRIVVKFTSFRLYSDRVVEEIQEYRRKDPVIAYSIKLEEFFEDE